MCITKEILIILGLDAANVELCIGARVMQPTDSRFSELVHTEPGRSGLLHPHAIVDIDVIGIFIYFFYVHR